VLSEEFNPQNTTCIPPVKLFFRLELEQTKQFSNSLLEVAILSKNVAAIFDRHQNLLSVSIRGIGAKKEL
jgi:hypothetical protein